MRINQWINLQTNNNQLDYKIDDTENNEEQKDFKLASVDYELNNKIKKFIKNNPFIKKLFHIYNVPLEKIDRHLAFHIIDLDGKNAKSKGEDIFINKDIYDKNFLKNYAHLIIHELTHWLTRQREEDCYFSDPEEQEAFAWGIAWEIHRGKHINQIKKFYLPLIKKHFSTEKEALILFKKLYQTALKLIKKYA